MSRRRVRELCAAFCQRTCRSGAWSSVLAAGMREKDNVRRVALLPSRMPRHGGYQTRILSYGGGFRSNDHGTIPRAMAGTQAGRLPATRVLDAELGAPR